MRIFDHMNKHSKCTVCGDKTDSPCVLVPIDGTISGGNEEAAVVHVECINLRLSESGLLYQVT